MSHSLIAATPHRPAPPQPVDRRLGHRLFLLVVLLWVMMFGLSIGTARADEPVTVAASAVALPNPRASHALPRRTAPELQVSAWVDQNGLVTPPSLKGKVQLVVFWGVNCPACVRKIPLVRQAATRYAGTDLVVIGLHNAQISPTRAAQFARDRELNYPIAIDRTGRNRYSFGATSTAYQVQAIPHAAVIDRDGSLKFVGDFEKALKEAEGLVSLASR